MKHHNHLFFYLPISLLTVSDTIAELGGKKWGNNSRMVMYRQKTVAGSISFAVSALVISIGWGVIFKFPAQQIIIISITTTVIATIAEMVSIKGWDNITVPLVTLVLLLALIDS